MNQDNTNHKDTADKAPGNKFGDEGIASPGDRLLQAEVEEIMASTPPTPGKKVEEEKPHSTNNTKPPQKKQQPEQRRPATNRASAIRTYYSDAAGVVRDKQVSMTDIALAEQRRRESQEVSQPDTEHTERKSLSPALFIVGLLVILGGVGVLGYVYVTQNTSPGPVPPTITHTLIPANHEQIIDATGMNRNQFLTTLNEEIENVDVPIGDIVALTLLVAPQTATTTRELAAHELIDLLQTDIDAALLRSIEEDYMLGIHNIGDKAPFLVLRTSFFENAFAGMLRWEPVLANDLAFIAQPQRVPESPTGIPGATSTTDGTGTSTVDIPPRQERFTFTDTIVSNRDVRALMNNSGDVRLVYSFPDKNTLIITNNTATLEELFKRLITARFSK